MRTRRRVLKTAMLAGLAMGLAAVASPIAVAADPPIKVVASFSILGDMVKTVGGERLDVVTLVGPDGDAHVFEPRPADVKAIADSRIVFVNGLGLEDGWMPRLIASAGYRGPVAVVSRGVPPLSMEGGEEAAPGLGHDGEGHDGHDHGSHGRGEASGKDQGNLDPHAWQNLEHGEIYVRNIADALIATDPAFADTYRASADRYLADIAALDRQVRAAIDRLPPDRRTVVSTHDAFMYFAETYGVRFLFAEGISTEAEPSAKDVAKLIRQIRAERIPAVFIENITDPRLIEQIRKETGTTIGGTLYSDALSPPDGPAPTYLTMFRHNLKTLTRALSGS